jgi:hypothetical protein
MKNNEAHDRILTWCRKQPVGCGLPCMRQLNCGAVGILDNSRFDSLVLAAGLDWFTVEQSLIASGLYARESSLPKYEPREPRAYRRRYGRRY